jgi:hypothetical protein
MAWALAVGQLDDKGARIKVEQKEWFDAHL